MALISRDGIHEALGELGRLAVEAGVTIELVVAGGAAMVLLFNERQSTRDLDVLIIEPQDRSAVRRMATKVASDHNWTDDWLNDAMKGFFVGLSAWRDDTDISDARRILKEVHGTKNEVWSTVSQFVVPGRELKAQLAFADLWEESGRGTD